MLNAIEDRELIALDGPNGPIRGTYHHPCDESLRIGGASAPGDRVGILFLAGLYATRAGNGDTATYWASSVANLGYPSFRIDLPGFGDSWGDPPADWLGYINAGGYAPSAAAVIKQITECFRLSGVVVVGHCAGAISAIYAAAISKECRGLVLMDPYFHLPTLDVRNVRQRLNFWSRRSRVGGALSRTFSVYKGVRLALHRDGPPRNANSTLLRCWKEVGSKGLPILILKTPGRGAAGSKPKMGEFDYLTHILRLAGRKSRVESRIVNGANHSFSNGEGRTAVRRHLEVWLHESFPHSIQESTIREAQDANAVKESTLYGAIL